MTTASKAIGGVVAVNLATIALWLLTLIPGWELIPIPVVAAITQLVISALGFMVVYLTPANKTIPAPPEEEA